MSTPNFYINEFSGKFPELNDLRAELYKKNILSKDYVEDNLFLIYRSIILNKDTKQIISFSCETPLLNNQSLEYLLKYQTENKIITKCYEGTLLSVFYHNNKWYVSTRRCLNSNESIWGDKSHFDMFMDALNEDFNTFTNKLNKDNCYYFVLIHYQNKNIVDYESEFGKEYKKLCLVFIRDKQTQIELDVYSDEFQYLLNDNIFLPKKLDSLEEFDGINKIDQFTIPPKSEGVIIKIFDSKINRYKLLKLQTINYQFAKSTGSDKNIFMGLIHLYQNDKLVDYVNSLSHLKKIINPLNTHESYDTIGAIDGLFKVCTSELFELFKILYDIKNGKQLNDSLYKLLPKEYKDLMFQIKGIYYKKKSEGFNNKSDIQINYKSDIQINYKSDIQINYKQFYLQIKDIYQLLKSLPTENLCALLKMRKLMFNWLKVNNQILDFGKISSKCDKVHMKLTAIYTNKLFPNIMPDDLPPQPVVSIVGVIDV